jgi:hypothetical protein
MRCIFISLALLLSTLTVAHARCSGTSPTPQCPCNGSGCQGRFCCVAFVDGKNYWMRADQLWPRSREERMSPIIFPLAINAPVR